MNKRPNPTTFIMYNQRNNTKTGSPPVHNNRTRDLRNRSKSKYWTPVPANPPGGLLSQGTSRAPPGLGYSMRNEGTYPIGRNGPVYVPPPLRRLEKKDPTHLSRTPNPGKPINPLGSKSSTGTFAKGSVMGSTGFNNYRQRSYSDIVLSTTPSPAVSPSIKQVTSCEPTPSASPNFKMDDDGAEPFVDLEAQINSLSLGFLNEERTGEQIPGQRTTSKQERLTALFGEFRMTNTIFSHQHPCQIEDVNTDNHGTLHFKLTQYEMRDIGLPLLLGTLARIHTLCLLLRTWASQGKSLYLDECVLGIDPFEISWTIQIHLFKMHKKGNRFIVMGRNNCLCVNKNILCSLIKDSLQSTYLSVSNAMWVFKVVSTTILDNW